MSAWILANGHIDVLVNAMAQFGVTREGAGESVFRDLGQTLWDENRRSVDHHYGWHSEHDQYVLHTTKGDLHPIAVLVALDGYERQSREHPGWKESVAYRWAEQLRNKIYDQRPELARQVPSRGRMVTAYTVLPERKAWPWGFFDDVEEAIAPPVNA